MNEQALMKSNDVFNNVWIYNQFVTCRLNLLGFIEQVSLIWYGRVWESF